ncbi:MAG: molybdenum cofactor guanylyltransferase [Bacillota bacterium]|uniref:Probable molybdenum cofactor guanylyltransferase n=1 Tax=Thermanaerosceptrum fracticalcis TaxID=1712410 RepID=A0A7G6E3J3_THEFR|nr:molybdenum cofactor guanylyltransferase [Thermanaerosceptrum fracticalcis]QNB46647.1 NTP transferase domain-containing protein [Thermanaerosceptrum fracticalcis]
MTVQVTGIVLAGGKSTRMNFNKALLPCGPVTMLEKIVDELRKSCTQVIIVAGKNEYDFRDCLVIPDIYPDGGPLGGIYAGLRASRTEYNFCMACDMPRFKGELVKILALRAPGYQVVVPQVRGCYEPLLALYHQSCLSVIEEVLKAGQRKITAIYPYLKVNAVTHEEIAEKLGESEYFLNINTPEDWESYRGSSF